MPEGCDNFLYGFKAARSAPAGLGLDLGEAPHVGRADRKTARDLSATRLPSAGERGAPERRLPILGPSGPVGAAPLSSPAADRMDIPAVGSAVAPAAKFGE